MRISKYYIMARLQMFCFHEAEVLPVPRKKDGYKES